MTLRLSSKPRASGGSAQAGSPEIIRSEGADWKEIPNWTVESLKITPFPERTEIPRTTAPRSPKNRQSEGSKWGDIPKWTMGSLKVSPSPERNANDVGFAPFESPEKIRCEGSGWSEFPNWTVDSLKIAPFPDCPPKLRTAPPRSPDLQSEEVSEWSQIPKWTVESLKISPSQECAQRWGSAASRSEDTASEASEWGGLPAWTMESLKICASPGPTETAGFAALEDSDSDSHSHSTAEDQGLDEDYRPAGTPLMPTSIPLSDPDIQSGGNGPKKGEDKGIRRLSPPFMQSSSLTMKHKAYRLVNPTHWSPAYKELGSVSPSPDRLIGINLLDFFLICESHRSWYPGEFATPFYYVDLRTFKRLMGSEGSDDRLLKDCFAIKTPNIPMAIVLLLIPLPVTGYFLVMFDFKERNVLILGRRLEHGYGHNIVGAEWHSWGGPDCWRSTGRAFGWDDTHRLPETYEVDWIAASLGPDAVVCSV
jgi:hypothetical protein